jgi:acetyl esterase/lipase
MKTKFLFLLLLLGAGKVLAQSTLYIDRMFAVDRGDSNRYFGAPDNYRGCSVPLYLDIYKPINQATERPVVLLMHGGAFAYGSRKDAHLVALADSLASRGYVVASIDYRLGYHQNPNLVQSFGCFIFSNLTGLYLDPCLYPADTMELYRAMYRGVQDVRGAIRYMKNRRSQDSTSRALYFVGGESAGGFIALAAGLLDLDSEKPAAADALPDAPTPNGQLCTLYNPCSSTSLARPDLGDIHGSLNLNGESDRVLGVISLAGGLMDPALLDSNIYRPKLYLYHQQCDPVVPYDHGPIYEGINTCVNCSGCPPISVVPFVLGGGGLLNYNNGLPANKRYSVWNDLHLSGAPVNCYYGLFGPDMQTCPQPTNTCRYCSNSAYAQCHDVSLTAQRVDSVARFLYDGLVTASPEAVSSAAAFRVVPNPFAGSFRVEWGRPAPKGCRIVLMDLQGREVLAQAVLAGQVRADVDAQALAAGMYLLQVVGTGWNSRARKVLMQ